MCKVSKLMDINDNFIMIRGNYKLNCEQWARNQLKVLILVNKMFREVFIFTVFVASVFGQSKEVILRIKQADLQP